MAKPDSLELCQILINQQLRKQAVQVNSKAVNIENLHH